MGRRCRHMNPAQHDPIRGGLCIDARFISGVSSGTGLQTWNSRPGGSHTFTQPNAGNRPIFTERVSGGQPAVVFTAASQHWMSRGSNTIGSTVFPYTFIIANTGGRSFGQSNTASYLAALIQTTQVYNIQVVNSLFNIANTADAGISANNVPATGVMAGGRRTSTTIDSITRPNGATVTTTDANCNLRVYNSTWTNDFSSPSINAMCLASGALSLPMRNRIMYHYGYSFKRAL